MRKIVLMAALLVAAAGLGACDSSDSTEDASAATTADQDEAEAGEGAAGPVELIAVDYGFKAPNSIKGGLVEIDYKNIGKEPHFASFARLNEGKTFEDGKAVLLAPPSDAPPASPPPFVEVAAMPTADAGHGGNMTFNLPAGEYILFCLIPTPDGVSHGAKGMLRPLKVTEGEPGRVPDAMGRFTVNDFAIGGLGIVRPKFKVGSNTVSLYNSGAQAHEINLVELEADKTVADVVAWITKPDGPPPVTWLSGLAIGPKEMATGRLKLARAKSYAFVCVIPDVLGDGAPHVAKGMYTEEFSVF